jgi:glycerol-3-phosphate dehydrogenase
MNRTEKINVLKTKGCFSVIIIGAGINGAGLFRDLSLQGVDVLLVDKGDYCSGASSAPSRMIHGGLRYLENGEMALVEESLKERNLLLKNAPHYVKPLPTTIPLFYKFTGIFNAIKSFLGISSKPKPRGMITVKIGLWLYDFLTRKMQVMPNHTFRNKNKTMLKWPMLNPKIISSATYYDAWISYPERLCLECIQEGEQNEKALALNYFELTGLNGKEIELKDVLQNKEYHIKGDLIVNASGAWIDFANQSMQIQSSYIGGTKGSHLVIDNNTLYDALAGHMIYFEAPGGRICIMFPFLGNVIVGTTDIPVDNPESVNCEDKEVKYILVSLATVFPNIKIRHEEVVFQYCGVRPLPRSDVTFAGRISRSHQCQENSVNGLKVYSLIGGKWTTFRSFSEEVSNKILIDLKLERNQNTETLAIGGGKDYPGTQDELIELSKRLSLQYKLSIQRVENLIERYGMQAVKICDYLTKDKDECLNSLHTYSYREIEYLIEYEDVQHLDDLILRRTSIGIKGEVTLELIEELNTILKNNSSDGYQTDTEFKRCLEILKIKHGLNL